MVLPRPTANQVLAQLAPSDLAALAPQLEEIALPRLMRVEERGRAIDHAYFPTSGLCSVLASDARGQQLEVAVIGREGMSGYSIVLADGRAPYETLVQISGHGYRIAAATLRRRLYESSSLLRSLLRYGETLIVQMAHTAVAHGRSTIEERLARWLLMTHDRIDGNAIPMTHEFLAIMLGVRRPGVTVALKQLENRGLIRRVRSAVEIVDRDALLRASNGAYGAAEAEILRQGPTQPAAS